MFNFLKSPVAGVAGGKPAHMNNWYEIALRTLARKLSNDLVVGKQYYNIPFGHSFLDMKIEGEKTHIVKKTLTNDGWVRDEVYDCTGNIEYHLQHFIFQKVWANTSKKADLDPQTLKKISIAVANVVYDSKLPGDSWVFPFYEYFIGYDVKEIRSETENDLRYINGYAYIQGFDDEHGCGGSSSGNSISHRVVKSDEYKILLDHSIYCALSLNFKGDKLNKQNKQDWYIGDEEKYKKL